MAADPSPPAKPRAARQLLGVFVLFHLAAVVLQALPDPGSGLNRAAWRDPTVQEEFKVWAGALSSGAAELSPEDLQDRLWTVASAVARARAALVRPFAPYAHYIGVRQPWRMFVAPHRFPTTLVIDVDSDRSGDGWRVVYADRSSEHTWRADLLGHDRMRAAIFRYGWPEYVRSYGQFSRWIATLAALDFPDARYVRVRMFRRRSPTPAEVREGRIPPGASERPVVIDLEGLR